MTRHLQFNWWKYAAVVLISIALWCGVFSALASPGQNERLSILYVGTGLNTDTLRAQLQTAMPSLTQQNIQKVTITATVPEKAAYKSTLMNYCASYDLIIIEEPCLADNVGQSIFARLTDELLSCFPGAAVYTEPVESTSLPFGLILYDAVTENTFSVHYSGDARCYLFFSPYSVNFDGLNEYGKAGNDAGLKTVQFLLEYAQ